MWMFKGCVSLEEPPELPGIRMPSGGYCYAHMFDGCTELQYAPALPATTVEKFGYSRMFQGCTSLTSTPKLPATTVRQDCYNGMFSGCTSLTIIPELPATELVLYCYWQMFYDCPNVHIAETQTDVCQYPYRIPSSGTGTSSQTSRYIMGDMFGWSRLTPNMNTTYYINNPPIPAT